MKVVTALTALAISTGALAAADSSLNDLQYLPNAGTKYGQTEYSHQKFDGGKANIVNQKLGYAIQDNFGVQIGLSYGHADTDVAEIDGLGDIELGARYRLAGFANRFDIVGKATVSPGKREIDGDEWNAYSGSHSIGAGVEYGNKTNERQWSVGAYLTHNFEGTTKVEGAGKYDDDAYSSLAFGASLLTRIGEKCFFKTSGAVTFAEEHDILDGNGEVAGSTLWNLGGEFQHFINSDLYLSAGTTAVLSGSSEEGAEMVYSVGASYQF